MFDLLAAFRCLFRGLPLFFRAEPKTPLRVLCLIALDTLHVLRTSRPLPRKRLRELALVLDFQACTNAAWDQKPLSREDYQTALQRLETAGLRGPLDTYLRQLRTLESTRPPIGGDSRNFEAVRAYREAVVRVSLGTLTEIALGDEDGDTDTLFRMAMQCQILDDVLDHDVDLAAGLPSFLTAVAPLAEARELTAAAARCYGASDDGVLPLRWSLSVLTGLTRLLVHVAPRFTAVAAPREPARAGTDPDRLLRGVTPITAGGRGNGVEPITR